MPVQVFVHGLVTVKVGIAGTQGLQTLGYTRNGAHIIHEVLTAEVPGDEGGGDQGLPIDIQYLGEISRVRLELTKFDPEVLGQLFRRRNSTGKTQGRIDMAGGAWNVGRFYFANNETFRLVLACESNPLHFPRTIPRPPAEHNMGTRFATVTLEFDCFPDANGVLYDSNIA